MDPQILIDRIYSQIDQFIDLNRATEMDIQHIYRKPGEAVIGHEELAQLQYDYSAPLYQKMIFRYRNAGGNIVIFWNGCDPVNQHKLLCHFSIYQLSIRSMEMDFFLWLIIHNDTYTIEYFYTLDRATGEKLIADYTKIFS